MNYEDKRIRKAWLTRIRETKWTNPTAVTLTLKQCIRLPEGNFEKRSASRYEQNARFFFNTMNRALYGNSKHRLRAVTVLEKSGRYHHHGLCERPSNVSHAEFEWLIRVSWGLSDWAYDQIIVEEADPTWLNYMFKGYSKEGIYGDSIVPGACYLDPSPPATRVVKPQIKKLHERLLAKNWKSPFPSALPSLGGIEEFLSDEPPLAGKIVETCLIDEPLGITAFI